MLLCNNDGNEMSLSMIVTEYSKLEPILVLISTGSWTIGLIILILPFFSVRTARETLSSGFEHFSARTNRVFLFTSTSIFFSLSFEMSNYPKKLDTSYGNWKLNLHSLETWAKLKYPPALLLMGSIQSLQNHDLKPFLVNAIVVQRLLALIQANVCHTFEHEQA